MCLLLDFLAVPGTPCSQHTPYKPATFDLLL